MKFLYRSYVALGDSLTEGLGDFNFESNRNGCGWADRLAHLLAEQSKLAGEDFHFANLALRGSKMRDILTAQLEDTIKLRPDLVTIMAGNNDLSTPRWRHHELRALLRGAIERLLNEGSHVVIANALNPVHLRMFKPMARRAKIMTKLIEGVAAEYGIPVLDMFRMDEFAKLEYWCDDMVHFSGHGHIKIANKAANLLGLDYNHAESHEEDMDKPNRNLLHTVRWWVLHVMPFIGRRIRGASSGDGLEPKHEHYVQLAFAKQREAVDANAIRVHSYVA